MKIHDLGIAKLNEGPLDALKNFGRAIVDPTDKSGKQEFYKYKTSMQTQFQRWANQTGAGKPDLKDANLIAQWLTDQYGVSAAELKQMGLPATGGEEKPDEKKPDETKPDGNPSPSPEPSPAPEETPKPGEETPKPDETKPGEETPKPEEKPAEEPAAAVDFKDPAKFKAEWDKYVAAQNAKNEQNGMGPFKLVTEPQLLSVLKQMWMSTGGTKAESVKPRGNALKESTKSKVTRK
jgi:outer membrane biosynthesis protein TonB